MGRCGSRREIRPSRLLAQDVYGLAPDRRYRLTVRVRAEGLGDGAVVAFVDDGADDDGDDPAGGGPLVRENEQRGGLDDLDGRDGAERGSGRHGHGGARVCSGNETGSSPLVR